MDIEITNIGFDERTGKVNAMNGRFVMAKR